MQPNAGSAGRHLVRAFRLRPSLEPRLSAISSFVPGQCSWAALSHLPCRALAPAPPAAGPRSAVHTLWGRAVTASRFPEDVVAAGLTGRLTRWQCGSESLCRGLRDGLRRDAGHRQAVSPLQRLTLFHGSPWRGRAGLRLPSSLLGGHLWSKTLSGTGQ